MGIVSGIIELGGVGAKAAKQPRKPRKTFDQAEAELGGQSYREFDTSGAEQTFKPWGTDRLSEDKRYIGDLKTQKWGQQNQGMFDNNLNRMRDTMNGVGPSQGVNALQAANTRTNAGLFSSAASARGAGGLGMASMGAANRTAANNQRTGQEGELIRAMEADAARKGMFDAINQNRSDSIAGESARYGAINNLTGDTNARDQFNRNVGMGKDEWLRGQQNQGRSRYDENEEYRRQEAAAKEAAKKQKHDSIVDTVTSVGKTAFSWAP
jgi:hypothetical protein